jgi:hypothetical protein
LLVLLTDELDKLRLSCGEKKFLFARPTVQYADVLILELFEGFCRFPCAPPDVIMDIRGCASVKAHRLVHLGVEENKQDR